jgi:hypothetical protein
MKKCNPSNGQNNQLVHWWLLVHFSCPKHTFMGLVVLIFSRCLLLASFHFPSSSLHYTPFSCWFSLKFALTFSKCAINGNFLDQLVWKLWLSVVMGHSKQNCL